MKNLFVVMMLAMALTLTVTQAFAEMYKWVDQNGVMHFSDSAPGTDADVETIHTPVYPESDPPPVSSTAAYGERVAAQPAALEEAPARKPFKKPSEPVKLFTTSWCGYCKKAKAFLQSNDIDFDEYDIEKDRKAAATMKQLGGRGGVPFAVINGRTVVGFSADTYRQVLGLP